MKKKFTPDYTIDFSKIEDYRDLVIQMTKKRVEAGKKIDRSDLFAFSEAILMKYERQFPRAVIVTFNECNCANCVKKTPWYKKLWNKIKSVFTRKK